MSTPKPDPRTIAERVAAEADRVAADAALAATREGVTAAKDGVVRAAEGALDAVEKLLFGKVGGAEAVLRREATADPLERLRMQYGAGLPAPEEPDPPKEDPEAVARRQLEELKRQRAAHAETGEVGDEGATPVKRTL